LLSFRFCSLTVIFVITLTLCVIECTVRTLPVERHSTCLPGRQMQDRSIQTVSGSTSVVAKNSELKLVCDTVFCLD